MHAWSKQWTLSTPISPFDCICVYNNKFFFFFLIWAFDLAKRLFTFHFCESKRWYFHANHLLRESTWRYTLSSILMNFINDKRLIGWQKKMTKNACAIQESNANHSIYYGFFSHSPRVCKNMANLKSSEYSYNW